MYQQRVAVLLLVPMVFACEPAPHTGQPVVNISPENQPATLTHHYTATGKIAAVVLSPRHGKPMAGFAQPWLLRIVDEKGLPVTNAAVEIKLTAPVAVPLEQLFISDKDHQDDGFYGIDKIGFAHAGRWHLDMLLVWQAADGFRQVDHVQLSVDVAGAPR